MSAYLIQSETLTGIADAIREKTGETGTIDVPDMASKISGITGGGSAGGVSKLAQVVDRTVTEITEADLQGVQKIGSYAFSECNILKTASIPTSVTEIGNHAFHMCASLSDIQLPNSIATIGSCAFEGCSAFTDITIPESVLLIQSNAFASCVYLKRVRMKPKNPPTLGYAAFSSVASNCVWVVDDGCGEAYLNATNWSNLRIVEESQEVVGGVGVYVVEFGYDGVASVSGEPISEVTYRLYTDGGMLVTEKFAMGTEFDFGWQGSNDIVNAMGYSYYVECDIWVGSDLVATVQSETVQFN